MHMAANDLVQLLVGSMALHFIITSHNISFSGACEGHSAEHTAVLLLCDWQMS
jgi:hypothetical protein